MLRLVCFLSAFALTVSAGALAQDFYKPATKVSVSPVGVTPTGKAASGGIAALLTMQGVDDSGRAAAYAARGVTYQPSTLGRIARGLRGGPGAVLGALAFGALIDGAGWVIDELTGQVLSGPPVPTTVPPGGQYWKNTFTNNTYPSAYAAAAAYSPNGVSIHDCHVEDANGIQSCQATVDHPTWGPPYKVTFGVNGIRVTGTQPFPLSHPGTQPSVIPDSQVDPLVGNAIADRPDTWPGVLREPDGRPRVTPEVQAALDDFRQELEADRGLTPTPDTPVDPDWDTQPNPTSTDWPSFCGWASVVCDFIDWYKAPPTEYQDVEMPEMELPGPSTWVSGLGQGSCPAPHVINLNLGPQVYEWDPWCDLASRIKPLVIASAAFAALLILAGVSRRGDGNA